MRKTDQSNIVMVGCVILIGAGSVFGQHGLAWPNKNAAPNTAKAIRSHLDFGTTPTIAAASIQGTPSGPTKAGPSQIVDFTDLTYGGKIRQLRKDDGHEHNFYYYRDPWNADGSRMLGIQSDLLQKNWRVCLYDGDGVFLKDLFPKRSVIGGCALTAWQQYSGKYRHAIWKDLRFLNSVRTRPGDFKRKGPADGVKDVQGSPPTAPAAART